MKMVIDNFTVVSFLLCLILLPSAMIIRVNKVGKTFVKGCLPSIILFLFLGFIWILGLAILVVSGFSSNNAGIVILIVANIALIISLPILIIKFVIDNKPVEEYTKFEKFVSIGGIISFLIFFLLIIIFMITGYHMGLP